MDNLTQIFVFSHASKMMRCYEGLPETTLWYPEIDYSIGSPFGARPRLPQEQIDNAHHLIGECVVTISEYIILWFLQEIRERRMKPRNVQLFCDWILIRIDNDGELIDKWPGGFFRERADLLFGGEL